jgi:hypothetical protein
MMLKALLADWNPHRFQIFQNHLSGTVPAGMTVCLDVLADMRKFDAVDRAMGYELMDACIKNKKSPAAAFSEIITFFRGAIVSDHDNTIMLDGILKGTDPSWKRSADREKLANRLISGQSNGYVKKYFGNVRDEFENAQENGREK